MGLDVATLEITIDTSSIDAAVAKLEQLGAVAKKTAGVLNDSAREADKAAGELDDVGKSASSAANGLDRVDAGANSAAGSLESVSNGAGKAADKLDEVEKSASNAADAEKDAAKEGDNLASSQKKVISSSERHRKAMEQLIKDTTGFSTSVEHLANEVIVELQEEISRLVDDLISWGRMNPQICAQMDKLADKIRELSEETDKCDKNLDKAGGGASKAGSSIERFLNTAMAVGKITVLGYSVKEIAEACIDFSVACDEAKQRLDKLETSFRNAFGGQAAHLLEGIREQSKELGLDFYAAAEAAHEFFEQGKGTPIAAEVDKVFESLMTAGRALDMTDDQMKAMLKDVGDLAQQETVSISDLADKLGSHLPNALETAASAMGMTIGEMNTMASQGKLLSGEVLPQLASALRDEYAEAAREAADTVEGMTARMATAWEQFKANLAHSGPAKFVVQFVAEGLETINKGLALSKQRSEAISLLEKSGAQKDVSIEPLGGYFYPIEDKYSEKRINNAINIMNIADSVLTKTTQVLNEGKQAYLDFTKE